MKNLIIGTAGHIDHGKTALIHALTGIDTDRLQEEKRRGITIDLGFSYLERAGIFHADIVDVPGHERYLKNMLAGAGAVQLVLMVVAADEGVMPQTREHLDLLSLLGVTRGIVVLTRCDLADAETRQLAREDVADAFMGSFLEKAPVVEVSSKTGEGIEILRRVIETISMELPPRPVDRPFFMPIDRVFTIKGFGSVVTGSILDGKLTVGDPVFLVPNGKNSRVRGLQSCGGVIETAYAGERAAVNLAGIEPSAVARGDVLAGSPLQCAITRCDVKLTVLPHSPHRLSQNIRLHLSVGTACVVCRARLLNRESLCAGESGYARLRLETPIAARVGDRFVVRFYSPVETIGGGVILDIAPHSRRMDRAALEWLTLCDSGSLRDQIFFLLSREPQRKIELQNRFYHCADREFFSAWDSLCADGLICSAGEYGFANVLLTEKQKELHAALSAYHKTHPLEDGAPLAELRKIIPAALLSYLLMQGELTRVGDRVALPDYSPFAAPLYQELSAKIAALYFAAGYTPPEADTLFQTLAIPAETVRQVFSLMLRRGELIETAPALYFSRARYDTAKEIVRQLAAAQGVSLSAVRDALGTSRRYAQALLERFDADGFTHRENDLHLLTE